MAVVWFLFAHPDDEFAVTAIIKDRCLAGDTVECAYLTDGSFAGQSSAPRRRETLRVLSRLGVSADRVHFIGETEGFADGLLHERLDAARGALLNLRAETVQPDEVFCPAWEGGHQDHDALHLVALAVFCGTSSGSRLRQYPLYNGSRLAGPFFRILSPLLANGPTEDRPAAWQDRFEQLRTGWSYPSQWRTWLGLFPFLAWHVVTDGRFRTQVVDPNRVLQAPHPGAPLYERRGFTSYKEFRAASDPFIASLNFGDRRGGGAVAAIDSRA